MEGSKIPVFIETSELAAIIEAGDKNLKIFDATAIMPPAEEDPIMLFKSKHIPG
jgi:hypothetical protein